MKTSAFLAVFIVVASGSVSLQAHTVYLDIRKDRLIWQQINGVNFHSYDAKIMDEGVAHHLDDYGKWHVSKDATKLSIRIHEGNSISEVRFPEKVARQLLELFKESPTKTQCGRDFDCTCFAHYAHGIDHKEVFDKLLGKLDPISAGKALKEFWQIEEFSFAELQPSDVVKLANGEELHFALYLAPEVYISKFGSGAVFATNLRDMQKVYPYRHREIWRPVDKRSCKEKIFTDATVQTVGACIVVACAMVYFFH